MAITSNSGVISGLQYPRTFIKTDTGTKVAGRPFTLWAQAGSPAAGSYDTTLNGVTLSSSSSQVTGQIPFTDPNSGNAYLGYADLQPTIDNKFMVIVADRLWHNGGFTITSTSAQNIVSPTWPARDINGATTGEGVLLALEVSGTVSTGTPTITVSYTNTAGTSGRTATNIIPTAASVVAGTTYFLSLQAGDTGVKSVESLTLSATWTSGTINLVAYRPLAMFPLIADGTGQRFDALTMGMPQLFNGSVPYFMYVPYTSGTASLVATIGYTWG